jgi:hypothetical protein
MSRAAHAWPSTALAILLVAATASRAGADTARWRQREFVIGGWYAGDPHYPERLPEIWRAGLNRVMNGGRSDRYDIERTARDLDSLRVTIRGFDLKLIAHDHNMPVGGRISFSPDARAHSEAIAEAVGRVATADSAALDGWMVWDEPFRDSDFVSAERLVALLDSLPATRERLAWINLLPSYVHGQQEFDRRYGADKQTAYRGYVDRVLAMYRTIGVPPPLLSVDHYPFQTAVHQNDLFFTLRTLVEKAESVSASDPPPIWVTVQLAPWRGRDGVYRKEPTFTQVRWQVSVALAYGAKGIFYWLAASGNTGEFGTGLIDPQGHHGAAYDSVRSLDRTLRAWGPTLMRLIPLAVLHQSVSGAEGIDGDTFGAVGAPASAVNGMSGGGGAGMAGTLRDRDTGEDWVIVVNKSLDRSATFGLTLARPVAGVDAIGADGVAKALTVSAGHLTVPKLAPGGAALLHLRAP